MKRFSLALLLTMAACTPTPPPSVQAVDKWLTAYADHDVETMLRYTWSGDKKALRAAMQELALTTTGTLAMTLPSKPLTHELVEIERKEPGRHTVLTVIEMKNPLAYTSKKIGHPLPNVPMTRPERRRFLSVQEGQNWGVKLDLEAALARVYFVAKFERKMAVWDYTGAEALLNTVPKPPDEANVLRTKDRLEITLGHRLELAKAKLQKRREGVDPFHCFSWVHGSDFGLNCESTAKACMLAMHEATREHRDTRKCHTRKEAVCFETIGGASCFGDMGSCERRSALLGTVTATCAKR